MKRLSIYVMTVFPGMLESFINYGIVRRAVEKKLVNIEVINIRDAAQDKHQTVDDTPYGGGAGMIMKADILASSLESSPPFRENRKPRVFFLTPQGEPFIQSCANEMCMLEEFVIVCGRYRGIDERFREQYITDELSIGDYVV